MKTTEKIVLTPLKTKSVVQQVVDSLTKAIINRELRPGDKIPTEEQLVENLGVSRNSIREAVKILVYLGVLEIRRADGTYVCEGFNESMIDPLIYGIVLDTDESYTELLELREQMEVAVLYLAIQKANEEDIRTLKERLDQLEAEIAKGPENMQVIFDTDNQFHDCIALIAKNSVMYKVNNVVRILTNSMRCDSAKGMVDAGRGRELFEAHQRIYEQLARRDIKNLNETVRGGYFTDVGFQAERFRRERAEKRI